MPTTSTSSFVSQLNKLFHQENRAALAHLRQSAYDPTDAQVFQVVGDFLPQPLSREKTDAHLIVATLFALYAQPFVATGKRPSGQLKPYWRSIGASAATLRRSLSVGKESLDQRMTALINSHRDDLPNRLRHLVQRLSSEDVEVDFNALLRDLAVWHDDRRGVRRRWAEDYWQAPGGDEDSD